MLEALDAAAVRRWYQWGLEALEAARDEINSLNVFPVPDADTGTNLHLTLESAVRPDGDERAILDSADLAGTATEMARLALLGARGSSGVILSQLLRGVAEVLAAERRPPRGLGLARALEQASALAYAAVSQPVEGTMLTVARAAAEAARATGSDDLHVVVEAATTAARRALAVTPEQLDVLGRAGVVDAGGRGVVVLLDVLQVVVEERPLPATQPSIAHPRLDALDAGLGAVPGVAPGGAQVYEVMYLLDASDDRIPDLRHDLDRVGDSVVVSGGDGLWNVHVHTADTEAAVDAGGAAGRPYRVRITAINVPAAATERAADHAGHDHAGHDHAGHDHAGRRQDGRVTHALVVALADDSPVWGLHGVLAHAGAHVVAEGGPLVGELHAAGSRDIALLAVSASGSFGRVAEETLTHQGFRVVTLPVRSPVQVLSAVAVHDSHRVLADDVAAMTAAAAATRCGEIHLKDGRFVATNCVVAATHTTTSYEPGEPLVGDDPCALALRALDALLSPGSELVTVVAAPELAADISRAVRAAHPAVEVTQVTLAGAAGADFATSVWLGVE